jgi:capsular polysaccharide transport system permease protein
MQKGFPGYRQKSSGCSKQLTSWRIQEVIRARLANSENRRRVRPHPLNPMTTIRQQTAWEIQQNVVFAIFLRELGARFGRYHLGYLWAILEPVAMVAVLCGVRILFGSEDIEGVGFPLFFASGILAYLLFQRIALGCLAAVESNLGLFNYQRVQPADIVVARSLLESIIFLGTSLIILPCLAWVGYPFVWQDTLMYFSALAGLLLFSLGIGLVLSVLGPLWQESKKIVPVLVRPLFFLSGIFYSVGSLPEDWKVWILVNPLAHAIELFRRAIFGEYTGKDGSLFYLWAWGACSLFFGLCVYRVFRIRLLTSGNIR